MPRRKAAAITIREVLPYLKPRIAYSMKEISHASGIGYGSLRLVLGHAIAKGEIVSRQGPPSRHGCQVYYLAGTAPVTERASRAENVAPRITFGSLSTSGSIDTYARSLRRHQELAMSVRRFG